MQPKDAKVDDASRICPRCGLAGARLMRRDQYASLFFIPLFPVKKGAVFLKCPRCGPVQADGAGPERRPNPPGRCPGCGYELRAEFDFCPKCGRRV